MGKMTTNGPFIDIMFVRDSNSIRLYFDENKFQFSHHVNQICYSLYGFFFQSPYHIELIFLIYMYVGFVHTCTKK
jgi:hypothetical protein